MIYKIEFPAMGSQILAALETGEEQSAILKRVPGWFDRWEDSLSRFRPESELNKLNASSGIPFKVSQTLWDVLTLSLNEAADSGGIVTPEVLESMEAIGYDRTFDLVSGQGGTLKDFELGFSRLDEIQLEPSTRTITLPRGLRIDLGGFGKGWAAHQAMRRLAKHGPALVDAGGDIAVSGPLSEGNSWPVGVEVPYERGVSKQLLALSQIGVATSGRDHRRWMAGGIWQHHIIDPRTGRSAVTDILTATILAPDVIEAEMAAKTVFIQGSRAGMQWLEDRPHLSGLVVLENGQSINTKHFNEYIWRVS
jgi:thiamine biosynthesis lipoprotein